MDTQSIRAAWLNSQLREAPVKVSIPALASANLIIRELSGDEGNDIVIACTDKDTQELDQKAFIQHVIAASLRNGNDPNKELIFSLTDMPQVFSKGLGPVMQTANASILLSGLDKAAQQTAKNALPSDIPSSTVVEGSLSPSPTPSGDAPLPNS